jgi:predicted dinucleotide-binding enzyme
MRIAVIGKGRVGQLLGPALVRAGHEVRYGVRDPSAGAGDDGILLLPRRDASDWAEIVILAVNWEGVDDALAALGSMQGRILIDCSNPLAFSPQDGLTLIMGFDRSAGEHVAANTAASVVKTLNQVSAGVMARAQDYHRRPVQLLAGDDAHAKAIVSQLLIDLGFRPVDFGGLAASRLLEPMAMVSIDLMFRHGHSPFTAWDLITPEDVDG